MCWWDVKPYSINLYRPIRAIECAYYDSAETERANVTERMHRHAHIFEDKFQKVPEAIPSDPNVKGYESLHPLTRSEAHNYTVAYV